MDNPEENRWPVWKLSLLLYPFTAAAVAINLFMLGLLAQVIGFVALSPLAALAWSLAIGVPVSWLAGRWVRRLLNEAG